MFLFLIFLATMFVFGEATGLIDWGYGWALSPLWIPLLLWEVFKVVAHVTTGIAAVMKRRRLMREFRMYRD